MTASDQTRESHPLGTPRATSYTVERPKMVSSPAFTAPTALPINAGAGLLTHAPVRAAPARAAPTRAAPSAILRRRVASLPKKQAAVSPSPAPPSPPVTAPAAATAAAEVAVASVSDGAVATKTAVKAAAKTVVEHATAGEPARAASAATLSKPVTVAAPKVSAPAAKAAAAAPKAAPAKPAVSRGPPLACGSGVSNHKNTSKAAKEAVASALAALPEGCVPDLAIVSATSDRGGGVIVNAFKLALGKIPFIGSTTCGSVLTPDGPVERGMSVMLLSSPGSFATASAEFGSGDVSATVTTAAKELKEKVDGKPVKAVYMTASPGNEETIMRSIHEVFGDEVPIVGGSAADEEVSGMWRIFAEGRRFPAGVAMLAIAGDAVKAGACITAPYTPSEKSMTVTGAEGRKLLTLNDRPAADVLHQAVGYPIYFEYKNGGAILGPMSKRPFALKRNDEYLSVHVASIEQPSGAVNLFAEAAVGDELVQMENVGGGDSACAAGIAIEESFKGAMEAGGIETPKAAFLVYCGGLGIAVGDKLEGNMTGNFASLPLPAAAVGVNAFGEQGPSKDGTSQHCNLAVGMLLLE